MKWSQRMKGLKRGSCMQSHAWFICASAKILIIISCMSHKIWLVHACLYSMACSWQGRRSQGGSKLNPWHLAFMLFGLGIHDLARMRACILTDAERSAVLEKCGPSYWEVRKLFYSHVNIGSCFNIGIEWLVPFLAGLMDGLEGAPVWVLLMLCSNIIVVNGMCCCRWYFGRGRPDHHPEHGHAWHAHRQMARQHRNACGDACMTCIHVCVMP